MAKKPKQRGTPKRRAKKKPAPTTALARRPTPRVEILPATPAEEVRTITEGISIGELGLVELKLTEQEESILSERVPLEEILVKPTRHPQPYLSHPTYTRWFNRAFGRTGWALVPVGKPALQGKSVVIPYVLHVHKQPVAFAMGEQDYFEGNREQTYGDAIESTVASALRRCAKRLGVGLEMWDRDFLAAWVHKHAVRVYVRERDGSKTTKWRRIVDAPLPFELGKAPDSFDDEPREEFHGGERGGKQERQRSSAPPPREEQHHHRHSGEPITDKQRQRLWVIIKNSGRDEEQVRAWLERKYKWTTTKEITRDKYDEVCKAVEDTGDLPR